MKIADYLIKETMYQSTRFTIYRATRESGTANCVLKVLDKKTPYTAGINPAENEYRLLTRIDSENVIKAFDWIDDKNRSIIVLEDIQGDTLKEFIKRETSFSIPRFLELAVLIAEGLAAIHSREIIHKDINSNNIIWNPKTNQLKIIDFDISSKLEIKVSHLGNPEQLQGTLPYLSPEQTGRMNCRVDQRSDMYSLGITFYEMLTGILPFDQSDAMEIVHAHLARIPEPPRRINECVPDALSKIIMKLLAKNPGDRYQLAMGLKYDLEKLRELYLSGDENPEGFKMGETDVSSKLQIPEKLYGREYETEQLLNAYHRVTGGAKEMMLITGNPGVGKTTLVNEIHKPITRDGGYFISGKFDQLHRNIPYFAFIQAFNQFCNLLLTEKQEVLVMWKERILNALGSIGKVLTDIIPKLEWIIGKQPDVPEVGGDQERNRLNFVFQCFIQAISTKEYPLVIFIDDLQWTDSSSLNLLKLFMLDHQSHYLLFVGAYRDNEVSLSHPLMATIEELQKEKTAIQAVSLKNLTLENVGDLLQDTLKTANAPDNRQLRELSLLIYRKTQGNAFFTVQFLNNLYKQHLLHFDFKQKKWSWDIAQIEKQNITDNVVELLVNKMKMLPHKVREILEIASCIGNIFELHTLSIISEKTQKELEKELEIAVIEQIAYPFDRDTYKFIHDRVHQAAYSLIPKSDKKKLHLKIGRLLLSSAEVSRDLEFSKESERWIFDIVNHFNTSIDLIEKEEEKLELARLNLKAGQKAKASSAYQLASDCLHNALRLLPDNTWQKYYDLTLTIYNEAIQTSYLNGSYKEVERLEETILKSAVNILDKAAAYENRIMSLMIQEKVKQAVEITLEIFSGLGLNVPRSPGKWQMFLIFLRTRLLMQWKRRKILKALPPMNDPEKQLILRIYLCAAVAIVFAEPELYPFMINKLLSMSLKTGGAPETPYLLAEYGFLHIFQGKIKEGWQMGKISSYLLEKLSGHEYMKVRLLTLSCTYIYHWKKSYKDVSVQHLELYQRAINVGDLEYAALNLMYYFMLQCYTGAEISVLKKKGNDFKNTVEQSLNEPLAKLLIEIHLDFISRLGEKNPGRDNLRDTHKDEGVPGMTDYLAAVKRFLQNLFRLISGLLFEDYFIIDFSGDLRIAPVTTGVVSYTDMHFYSSLMRLQLYRTSQKAEKSVHLKKVRQSLKLMKQWAEFGPINFQPRYYLMQAELYRVTGKQQRAAENYDKAITSARQHEYPNIKALANELAAKFHMESHRDELAEFYFKKAWQSYRQWGAWAKVKHLEENYPKYLRLFAPISTLNTAAFTPSAFETPGAFLDVSSIIKASQTLSGEVQLKELLKKMMQILIENAGAQRGVLIENKDGSFIIRAEGTTDGVPEVLQDLPVEECEKVPLSVINYVARSKQKLVFDNISNDIAYSTDNYIREHQPKSVVCCPIIKKDILRGIIYLENNRVEGAFNPARIEVLNMLSAQIAISIENAGLYENLEEKVIQRTIALQEANDELKESQKKINDSVNYASRIQHAVLPGQDILAELLPRHFMFYRPCSAVSGDFYWIKQVEGKIIVTVADCTGHGVPGALLSMLGMAFLNEIVPQLAVQSQLTAGNILDQLRSKVKTALKQRGEVEGQREGMDIALCIIEPAKKQLQFAGAHLPLYLIRKNQLIEVKGDKMPISLHRKEHPFTNHEMPLQADDMIYLFSDGYADQFSEEKHEKFNKTNLKKLLIEINQELVSRQKEILVRRFEKWKGDFSQVDDVLVFGIRV